MQKICFVQALIGSVVLFPFVETHSSSRPDYIWKPTRLCLVKLCFKKALSPSLFTLCLIAWPRLASVAICCIVLYFLERWVLVFFIIRLFLVIFVNLNKHCQELKKRFQLLKCENGRKKGKIKSSLFLCLWCKGAVFFWYWKPESLELSTIINFSFLFFLVYLLQLWLLPLFWKCSKGIQ